MAICVLCKIQEPRWGLRSGFINAAPWSRGRCSDCWSNGPRSSRDDIHIPAMIDANVRFMTQKRRKKFVPTDEMREIAEAGGMSREMFDAEVARRNM